VIVAGIFFSALPGYTDIYRYIDSKGVLHFTNAPTSSNYRLYIKERPKIPANSNVPNRYDRLITAAAKRHGISFSLLKAIIKVESDYNPRAVSKKGAKGLMQIMPATSKALNINNIFDPWENIMGGTEYFKQLFNRFDGKLPLALAAYNAGPEVVDRYKSVPPFQETERYVQKVMKYYYVFKKNSRL
jgi:soluble lytic murein transglycosylase